MSVLFQVLLFLPLGLQHSVRFEYVDVAAERGIGAYTMAAGMGGGVAAADYDGDGDVDIFVPTGALTPDCLYLNRGNGKFDEIAGRVGLASTEPHRSALWFDYDGDGRLDLVVCGVDAWSGGAGLPLLLYHQEVTGSFRDTTLTSHLTHGGFPSSTAHVAGIAAGDIDRDGYLDLYLSLWSGRPTLQRNRGDGTFEDITASSGLMPPGFPGVPNLEWQPLFFDFDRDGWQDLYVTVDFGPNRLFINQGDSTFVESAAAAGANNDMNDMGVTLGDFDGDGDFDLYVTNIFEAQGAGERNVLLQNETSSGLPSYTESSRRFGVDQGYWGWGATFLDADGDGWSDLAATNGFGGKHWVGDPSLFFLGRGPRAPFTVVSSDVGFDDTYWGSCLIAFDLEGDGDPDLLQTCNGEGGLRLLENRRNESATPNHWLRVRVRQPNANNRAIGAVVRCRISGSTLVRAIGAGTSFMGQEPAEALFGLGQNTWVDELTVEWPSGGRTTWRDVAVDSFLTLSPDGALVVQ